MPRLAFRRLLLAGCVAAALVGQTTARAATKEFDDMSVAELQAAMDAGALTAEKLVELSLARIAAYDNQGPKLHAVMALNPNALAEARALDAERKAKGPRSPMHGMLVILKDNIDTVEMPTTGGSVLLEGSYPPDGAYIVKKLRDAGAIILAKMNLSEFAGGGQYSSLGGQSHNPHDPMRTPSGSSGGTGVGVAAGYSTLGVGTDTGGSVRGPAAANGVVAMRPTQGLVSRDGVIPLSLSLDMTGPYGRHVADVAAMLSAMTGVDPKDPMTKKQVGKVPADYTKFLDANALKGARIGVARDFMGQDPNVDWVINAAIDRMKAAGATVVDVRYPRWLLTLRGDFYQAVRWPDFAPEMKDYLATLKPGYPKTLEEMIDRAEKFNGTRPDGAGPNTARWALFKDELASGGQDSYRYRAVKEHIMPAIAMVLDGVIAENKLDAIVYPTSSVETPLIAAPPPPPRTDRNAVGSGTNIQSLAGFPDLVVPAGFTGGSNMPVAISFVGRAFSEPKLLALAYSFEQLTNARRRPAYTPPLEGATVTVPGS